MICITCGQKFFVKGNSPTPCPSCGAIHLPIVVSAEFLDYCKEQLQEPHAFAKWCLERAWEDHKDLEAYGKEKSDEDLAKEGA